VGKHFPGHGAVAADSHLALPVDSRRFEDVLMEDILPFERMIHYGLEAVMPAHVVYERCDGLPAGFSPFWLQQVLRRRLGFQGAIFSDDLSMEATAATGGPKDRAAAALTAGCDMVLVCNDPGAAAAVLEHLEKHVDPTAQMRLVRMHGRHSLERQTLHLSPRWQKAVRSLAMFEESPSLELELKS